MHPSFYIFLIVKTATLASGLVGVPAFWVPVLFFGCDLWLIYQLFAPRSSTMVKTYSSFETSRDEVWLTIDDGPDEHDTPRILDLLEKHGARATFFIIGERAARHPQIIAEIVRRGHEIAHHTHTHAAGSFWCATLGRVRRELDRTFETLSSVGVRPTRFRAPVGFKNIFLPQELRERGLVCVAWNARGCDSFAKNPAHVVTRVLRDTRPGAVLLMHEGPQLHANVRVHAIAQLLAALDARGLKCVIPTDGQLRS